MRQQVRALVLVVSAAWAMPVRAQVPEWVTQILGAARLPVSTAEARREGVNSDEIRGVLEAMRGAGVPAHEAVAVIDTARVVRREHGPVDNFGAFVQSQLAAGKRGRELAAAIRAEHARQGKGPGARGTPGQGRERADTARGRGRSDEQSPGRSRSPDQKPDNRGRGNTRPPAR